MSYWNGDSWRWDLTNSGYGPSISVIEPTRERKVSKKARRVPFGFARALHEPERGKRSKKKRKP